MTLPAYPLNSVSNPAPSAVPKTRILVADHPSFFREELVTCINRQEDLVCCSEAASDAILFQAMHEHKPDLVLLNPSLPHETGVDLIRKLKALCPHVSILVVSDCGQSLHAADSLNAGAHGFVMKEEETAEFLDAIRSVRAGEIFVGRKLASVLLGKSEQQEAPIRDRGLGSLSERQLQVFKMIGDGLNTRQIANCLGLSPKTIEAHGESIKHKLGLPAAATLLHEAVCWRASQSVSRTHFAMSEGTAACPRPSPALRNPGAVPGEESVAPPEGHLPPHN